VTVGSLSVARAGVPPALAARLALGAAVLAHLVIVEVLFATAGTGKNSVLTVAKFFGLHAASIMMLQLVLVARLPWLDRRIGMDRLTVWHRWIGFTLVWTVLTHATLVVLGYAWLDSLPVLRTFLGLAGVVASLLGMCAAAIIVTIAAFSMRYARRRMSYETWHALHVGLYLAILLALLHQGLEGTTFASSPAARAYWWTMWTLVLLAFVVGRIAIPIWRNTYHRFQVAAVVPESDNVVSVYVTGRHLDRLSARAGQFFIWRFPGHNGWWQANPFSLSAAPDGRTLRLTAKAVGETSAGLRNLPVGTRALLEGPYGAFTALHQTRNAVLLIAGGVGITPIRALLEESTAPAVVLYRVHTTADAVLLPELQELARRRDARVHVLAGRTGSGNPPLAPFEPDNLLALVPDIADRDVFVCGPLPMTEAVLGSLRRLGVPRAQVHAERFSLA
jgi:predicted ferric reductase